MAGVFTLPIHMSSAITTQIDLMEIIAGSTTSFDILGWEFGQSSEIGDANEEELFYNLIRVTGSPTTGSGGQTPTFAPTVGSGSPATTAKTGNTVNLTGGTQVELKSFPWNTRQNALYVPTPDTVIRIAAGTRLVLKLAKTPAHSITSINGYVDIAELE